MELQGWTVAVEEGGDTCAELNGGDFVLDGLAELVAFSQLIFERIPEIMCSIGF